MCTVSLLISDKRSLAPHPSTYPEDEVKKEKEVFHTYHPALDFAHVSGRSTPCVFDCNRILSTTTEQLSRREKLEN